MTHIFVKYSRRGKYDTHHSVIKIRSPRKQLQFVSNLPLIHTVGNISYICGKLITYDHFIVSKNLNWYFRGFCNIPSRKKIILPFRISLQDEIARKK